VIGRNISAAISAPFTSPKVGIRTSQGAASSPRAFAFAFGRALQITSSSRHCSPVRPSVPQKSIDVAGPTPCIRCSVFDACHSAAQEPTVIDTEVPDTSSTFHKLDGDDFQANFVALSFSCTSKVVLGAVAQT
jgi:hypothetical protein